jgi:glycosyltransferase involved in cell wall biosynthesis
VGETAGLAWEERKLKQLKTKNIEFLGRLPDKKLWQIYGKAKAFLALSKDEDFHLAYPNSNLNSFLLLVNIFPFFEYLHVKRFSFIACVLCAPL